MSSNQPTKLKKTIKQMEEELMAQQRGTTATTAHVSPFARGAEIAYQRSFQAPTQYHLATAAELSRIQEQQRPQPRAPSPPRTTGLTSATLARERAYENARRKQMEYYAMLEQRYGAIRGDDGSYLAAMERYDHDVEVERKKKETEQQKAKSTRALAEEELFQRQQSEREQQEHARYEEEVRQYNQRMRQQQQYYQQQQQQQQPQQQQQQYQQQQHAHASVHAPVHAPVRAPEPAEPDSPKSILNRRYPLPQTKQEAFAILKIAPSSTQKEIIKAYRVLALLLHPDKNMHNPVEATIRFQQLQTALNIINSQSGGRRRYRLHRKLKTRHNRHRHSNRHYKRSTKSSKRYSIKYRR